MLVFPFLLFSSEKITYMGLSQCCNSLSILMAIVIILYVLMKMVFGKERVHQWIVFVNVRISGHDSTTKVVCRTGMRPRSHFYILSRTYYHHSRSSDFQRIIATVCGMYITAHVNSECRQLNLWFAPTCTCVNMLHAPYVLRHMWSASTVPLR